MTAPAGAGQLRHGLLEKHELLEKAASN